MKEFNPETHALVEVSALNELRSNLLLIGRLKTGVEYTDTEVVHKAVEVTHEIHINNL